MISPDFKTFQKLSRKGNIVAISKTISADLETPVSCFMKLAANLEHAFLLESAEQEEKIGRYSFIGLSPTMVLQGSGGETSVRERGKPLRRIVKEHIVDVMEKLLVSFRFANQSQWPQLCAGFVGYLGYENVEYFEDVRLSRKKGPGVPDSIFVMPSELVVFDHYRKTLSIVLLACLESPVELRQVYQRAVRSINALVVQLRRPLHLPKGNKQNGRIGNPASNISPVEFRSKVNRIKSYIRAGDCIQVVLSQRFSLPQIKPDFQIYRALRSINPSPYMFYFRSGKFRLIGSSPEMLVKKAGSYAELRPIAGTRPRDDDPKRDIQLEESLRKSVKEMAEHVMLVDLGRNDLGRVCRFDSVRVGRFARVERYSHVMHLVSDVCGQLKPGKTAFDLLKATFPAGTLSGAPKIRAMQIIDELEPEKRGPYGGSLGYFSFNGDMDMCIVIRTLVLDGKRIYLQAGAGIVKDSNPAKEYAETVNKARALLRAIETRGDF
jgi:anthranilate synthase component 1